MTPSAQETAMHTATVQPTADYANGGPCKVVIDGWCVSLSIPSSPSVIAEHDGKIKLHAYKPGRDAQGRYASTRHPLDGTHWDTTRDAWQAAYTAGLNAFMVYERHAAEWGLPVGE
jgi:hypothetical protein